MGFLVSLLFLLLDVFIFTMIIGIIMSWLIAFNVLSTSNTYVAKLYQFISRIVEPVLAPVRRIIPPIGGIDISPIVVIIGAELFRYFVSYLLLI